MLNAVDGETLSLENCDREPIHIPGTIQPFGALIAGELSLAKIDFASANTETYLKRDPKDLLGLSLEDILPMEVLHDLRNILSFSTASRQRERVGRYEINGQSLDLYAHRNPQNLAIVEFELADLEPHSYDRAPIEQARLFLAKASTAPTIDAMLHIAAAGLHAIVGYDRVMAYRYASDGSGEVVAETVSPNTDSFLGLRYPAWDVPTQARALQVKNPLRMLSDVLQEPIPVLSHDARYADLDMSFAHVRGISAIHVEYLQNMGVGATLTIGLVVDGQLWGMFACHHNSARAIGFEKRLAAELMGQMISLLVKARIENEQAEGRAQAAKARQRILGETDATTDLLHSFPSISSILGELVACDGLAVLRDDKLQSTGSVPSPEAIRAIGTHAEWDEHLLVSTTALGDEHWHQNAEIAEDLKQSAGCMIVRSTAAYPLQLLFFRDEKVHNVKWAGKPEKDITSGPMGPRLTPRGSFETYLEEQRGQSEPWSSYDLAAAREIQVMLTQITAKGERAQLARHKDLVSHQRQQDLMIAELNHRVKNILALIRSLSRQAKSSSASLESYALALEQRIAALAAAHDLAVSDTMRGVSLRGIINTELNPFSGKDDEQIVLSGPTVGLRADVAPMIALVFHEVVSNAVKYGALSNENGIVQVKWSVDDEALKLTWREVGGPEVKKPTRHGFGRSLIEKAIPYEFDGSADLEYDPAGVRFSFSLPIENLVDLEDETEPKLAGKISEIRRIASDKHVLLVEDNVVLAMDMVESLSRLGADQIETAATIETGLAKLNEGKFHFAVLDMNLRGEVAFDLALRLKEKNIPFVFVTGYGSKIDVPAELSDIPILTKPVDDGTLSKEIAAIIENS